MVIPFHHYGQAGQVIHFGHANGYPPPAYRQLFEGLLSGYQIMAMRMRPLWPDAEPNQLHDWKPLAEDLAAFLQQENLESLVGAGHSMGATTVLRLALCSPQTFRALILIDPVLFPPKTIRLMRLIHTLDLTYRLHPLVKSALNRRRTFESETAMFENYRKKEVFRHMDETALQDYVHALASPAGNGQISLAYPPEWEARIYATGILADMELWRDLSGLKPPLLVIRGEHSDTFRPDAQRLLRRKLPSTHVQIVPDATHLVALEKPAEVSRIMKNFLGTIL